MATLDLDAARAARAAEAETGGPHTFTFAGAEYTLPVEAPMRFGTRAAEGDTEGALNELLGDQAEKFWAASPSINDVLALVPWLVEAYGFADMGESPASPTSLKKTGKPSRPTSTATTA